MAAGEGGDGEAGEEGEGGRARRLGRGWSREEARRSPRRAHPPPGGGAGSDRREPGPPRPAPARHATATGVSSGCRGCGHCAHPPLLASGPDQEACHGGG